jgi:hypothetical protein
MRYPKDSTEPTWRETILAIASRTGLPTQPTIYDSPNSVRGLSKHGLGERFEVQLQGTSGLIKGTVTLDLESFSYLCTMDLSFPDGFTASRKWKRSYYEQGSIYDDFTGHIDSAFKEYLRTPYDVPLPPGVSGR